MKNLFQIMVAIVIITTLIYAYARSQTLINGPTIDIYSPKTNVNLNNPLKISGKIKNANYLSINNLDVELQADGSFSVLRSFTPGYNIIKFYLHNKHGKEATVYKKILIAE